MTGEEKIKIIHEILAFLPLSRHCQPMNLTRNWNEIHHWLIPNKVKQFFVPGTFCLKNYSKKSNSPNFIRRFQKIKSPNHKFQTFTAHWWRFSSKQCEFHNDELWIFTRHHFHDDKINLFWLKIRRIQHSVTQHTTKVHYLQKRVIFYKTHWHFIAKEPAKNSLNLKEQHSRNFLDDLDTGRHPFFLILRAKWCIERILTSSLGEITKNTLKEPRKMCHFIWNQPITDMFYPFTHRFHLIHNIVRQGE